jgi:hypothetical protein
LGSPFALNKRELQATDVATFNPMPQPSPASVSTVVPSTDPSNEQVSHSHRVVAQKQVDRP